jgi:6-pyruvoyltetrahydropterin/6-carboxytetrahydropterin synthase
MDARMSGDFTVRVEARFEAAHFLREYRGISEPLHGHSYKVEAELAALGGGVDRDAIAVDFVSARRKLEILAKKLDYGCINDVPPSTASTPRPRTSPSGSIASCRRLSLARARL